MSWSSPKSSLHAFRKEVGKKKKDRLKEQVLSGQDKNRYDVATIFGKVIQQEERGERFSSPLTFLFPTH